jgi:hypothetical protein
MSYPPELEALFCKEHKLEGGHPDFEYTLRKFAEIEIEERLRSRLIAEAFDRMSAAHKKRRKSPLYKLRKSSLLTKIGTVALVFTIVAIIIWIYFNF